VNKTSLHTFCYAEQIVSSENLTQIMQLLDFQEMKTSIMQYVTKQLANAMQNRRK